MANTAEIVAENLARVRQQISDATDAAGRDASEIQLVGVTKYVGPALVAALFEAGCENLGESRPQQLWDKAEALADQQICWHVIGQLQRNKIRRTLPLTSLIHSGDSVRMMTAVDRIAAELAMQHVPMLIEVNISGDEAKHGFAPGEVEPALDELASLTHVKVCGLMCIASREGGPEAARSDFARMRELRDRLLAVCPEPVLLTELSMGMSGDFQEAIREGSTIVRVGSTLFEGITPEERQA